MSFTEKKQVKDEKEFGRHFCSEVHAVEVTARIKSGDGASEEVRKYHLIVKSQPQSTDEGGGGGGGRPLMQHNLASSSHTFEKEVQMYSQVYIPGTGFFNTAFGLRVSVP